MDCSSTIPTPYYRKDLASAVSRTVGQVALFFCSTWMVETSDWEELEEMGNYHEAKGIETKALLRSLIHLPPSLPNWYFAYSIKLTPSLLTFLEKTVGASRVRDE